MRNILVGVCFGGNNDDPECDRLLAINDRISCILGRGGHFDDAIPGLKYIWESSEMRVIRKRDRRNDKGLL